MHYYICVYHALSHRFSTGPGVTPATVPGDVTHLVLVLNGREQFKVDFSEVWLRSLVLQHHLEHTAVVLLGNESCSNGWTRPYMRTRGGLLDLVFLVYDSSEVDGTTVYQWPLGVATYVVRYKMVVIKTSSIHLAHCKSGA